MRERIVGLGVMGFHSFLQAQQRPVRERGGQGLEQEDVQAHPRPGATRRRSRSAEERGACPDAADYGFKERFSNKLAIAPTASISIICGGASPGIEPIAANVYNHKTLSGSFIVRNPYLEKVLASRRAGTTRTPGRRSPSARARCSISTSSTSRRRRCSRRRSSSTSAGWSSTPPTARPSSARASRSNLFLPADVHKRDLHQIHMMAWKRGVKSLYYCRSLSIQRAETVAGEALAAPMGDHAIVSRRESTLPRRLPLGTPAAPQRSDQLRRVS